MAFMATISILIDASNEDEADNTLNKILAQAIHRADEQEGAGVIDWNIEAVDRVNESIEESMSNGVYEWGDVFSDWVILSGDAASLSEDCKYWSKEYGWTTLDLSTKYSAAVREIPEECGEGATWVKYPSTRN